MVASTVIPSERAISANQDSTCSVRVAPRMDDVDRDAVGSELVGEWLGQLDQRGIAHTAHRFGTAGREPGNYDELGIFAGLRPSEEIALVVIDYDAAHGVLSVTKARVNGIDQDVTKTGEERRSKLAATDRQ